MNKQVEVLAALEVPLPDPPAHKPRGSTLSIHEQTARALQTIQATATYYERKINEKGSGGDMEAGDVMKGIGVEIERDGVHIEMTREPEPYV